MEIRTDGSKGVQESGSNDVTENGTVDRITEHGTITSISVSVIQHPAGSMVWPEQGAHLIELTAQAWLAGSPACLNR
jgi:hypothetical protein